MQIRNYIAKERDRFETQHNNMFAFSLEEIARYQDFISIIFLRYKHTSEIHLNAIKEFQNSIKGKSGVFTDEQMQLDLNMGKSQMMLQLEIESFYLFAKILLDKISR